MCRIESFRGSIFFSFILVAAMLAAPVAGPGATMTWNNSSGGNWNIAANWDPANVPDASGESATVPSSLTSPFTVTVDISPSIDAVDIQSTAATMNLNTRTLTLLTAAGLSNSGVVQANSGTATISITDAAGIISNTGQINVRNNCTLNLNTPSVSNDGTILVNSDHGGNPAYLVFNQNATLSSPGGTGFLRLDSDGGSARLNTDTGFTLSNATGHTIDGRGIVYAALNNAGMVQADENGKTLSLQTNAKSNSGTMRATAGGTLEITTTLTQSSSGILRADNASTVSLESATVTGGTFQTAGSGVINVQGTTIGGLINEGNLAVINNTWLKLTSDIINKGSIALNSSGNATYLYLLSDATLSGGGTLNLSNNAINIIQMSGTAHRLTNASDHTIRGSGDIGYNNISLTNHGGITADQSTPLIIDPLDGAGNAVNDALLLATSGATLQLQTGYFTNTGGRIRADDASTVKVVNSSTIDGGTLETAGTGVIDVNASTLNNVTNNGKLVVGISHSMLSYGYLDGMGSLTLMDSARVTADQIIQNSLTIGKGGKLTIRAISGGPLAGANLISTVPEPAMWLLILSALTILGGWQIINSFRNE